jgi:hypothetical protein
VLPHNGHAGSEVGQTEGVKPRVLLLDTEEMAEDQPSYPDLYSKHEGRPFSGR